MVFAPPKCVYITIMRMCELVSSENEAPQINNKNLIVLYYFLFDEYYYFEKWFCIKFHYNLVSVKYSKIQNNKINKNFDK